MLSLDKTQTQTQTVFVFNNEINAKTSSNCEIPSPKQCPYSCKEATDLKTEAVDPMRINISNNNEINTKTPSDFEEETGRQKCYHFDDTFNISMGDNTISKNVHHIYTKASMQRLWRHLG